MLQLWASPRSKTSVASAMLALLAGAILCGCTPTRFAHPFLSIVPQGAGPSPGTMSVTATCPRGAVRVGGGFLVAPDNANKGMVVRGSYPSDHNGWTLEVENTSPVPADSSIVQVVAYCAQRADLSLNATVEVHGTPGAPVGGGALTPKTFIDTSPCVAPAVLTGGGYYVDGPLDGTDAMFNAGIQESAPNGSSWHVEFGEGLHAPMTRLVRSFAVCTAGLPAGAMAVKPKVPVAGVLTETEVDCNTAYTTAGGYRLNDTAHLSHDGSTAVYVGRAFESAAVNDFQRWSVQTNTIGPQAPTGLAPVSSVAICAAIP